MGLDWCLNHKPRPGHEEEFVRLSNEEDPNEEDWKRVSVSPYESSGCPQVGIDERATRYFLEEIIPSHREGLKQGRNANARYTEFWSRSDEEILADKYGAYIPELAEAKSLSTAQTMAPFQSLAGAFSFRGKIIGYSQLLDDDLRNEAYQNMTPEQMADYAGRICDCAMRVFKQQTGVELANAPAALDYCNQSEKDFAEAAEQAGYTDTMLGWRKIDEGKDMFDAPEFERSETQELACSLKYVLDAGNWLRFWADLGHPMHAWY